MFRPPPIRRGIALVIVLVFLVLLSGIILAFFSGVTTQRSFSRSAADAASTQQLADSAVNIVMAQIVDATGTTNLSPDGTTLAWASQPGMIRTYDDTGAPQTFFKLYSSDAPRVTGSGFSISTDDPNNIPNGGWNSSANVGIYTDLNAPTLVTDGSGAIVISSTNGSVVSSGTYSAIYPIIDPFAENTLTSGTSNGVDGFSISKRPAFSGGATAPASSLSPSADPTATTPGSGATANPAPMPVKWLYVLSQGQIISPDPASSSNGILKFSGSNALVSATNPIVGRIAFWADDDTCKVNINTASEGVYWDTPRVFSIEDSGKLNSDSLNDPATIPGMAICQPVQKEYQRYPGHPATTCLSPVFGNVGLPGAFPWQPWLGTVGTPLGAVSLFNQYYAIAPRETPGGSNAGTTLTGTDPFSGTIAESGTAALIPHRDRLYASVDEIMFTGTTPIVGGTSARITNPDALGNSASTLPTVITKRVLEKTRFFITANSNAPEVTLFNTPRVSMWPVWDAGQIQVSGTTIASGTTARTAYDNLAAFCGTIGGKRYYFTRSNSRSDTADYNLTDPVTGQPRNQNLYQYLQSLTLKNIPGFGGSFFSKFGTDRDQILTLMYDYIRCVNLADSTTTTSGTNYPYTPLFVANVDPSSPYCNGEPNGVNNDFANLFPLGSGEVVPIKIPSSTALSGTTMGVGRILTISEADLLFYASAPVVGGTNKFRAVFLVQFASPMQGMAPMRSSLKYSVSGLDQFQVYPNTSGTLTWRPLGFQANGGSNGTNYIELSDIQTGGGRGIGGVEGPAEGLYSLSGTNLYSAGANSSYDVSIKKLTTPAGAAAGNYPFFTGTDIAFKPVVTSSTTFQLEGANADKSGDVTIKLMTQDANVTIQTITVNFPAGTFMAPTVVTTSTNFNARLNTPGCPVYSDTPLLSTGTAALVTTGDTLIGVQPAGVLGNNGTIDPTGGDYRMIAALPVVPKKYYRPHYNYAGTSGTNSQFAHGMIDAGGDPYWSGLQYTLPGGTSHAGLVGSLVSPVNYYSYNHHTRGPDITNPYVPSFSGTNVARASSSGGGPGDWDTGIGNTLDGAYMNKPDEGDTRMWNHSNSNTVATVLRYPYQLGSQFDEAPPGQAYFSPNKQVPSPLMFGSIPTGVQRFLPWQSLLFNPKPEDSKHPGLGTPLSGPPFTTPPDYLIADLFWMPVVEPYAISQPFSTAGKINLNYQILPFDYINRKTGLYAVMKATQFLAIPVTDGTTYKPLAEAHAYQENMNGSGGTVFAQNPNRRQTIDIGATLQACDTKFAGGDIYKSATEVCGLNLIPTSLGLSGTIPAGQTAAAIMAQFWQNYRLTGNNVRDKPYVDIYPRLTTKSNTFTVHIWVQSLKQSTANAKAGQFVDPNASGSGNKDAVVSEYRGSTTIERYIDPNDPRLTSVDFATTPTLNIDPYYKFHVIGVKRFSP